MVLFLFTFSNCRRNEDKETPAPIVQIDTIKKSTTTQTTAKLISCSPRSYYSRDQLRLLASYAGYGSMANEIKFGAQTYYVEYKTTYLGKDITASGLLHLPDNIDATTPLLSVQHGTIFKKTDAPSADPMGTPTALLASTGYITIEPDYIGYGASSGELHPYYHKKYSSMSVINLILATKEYLKRENKPFNNKVFLAGYSEGGYTTLSAFEELDKNKSAYDMPIAAVAAGAGGYDLNGMLNGIMQNEKYTYPAYLAFVISAYDLTYNWSQNPTYYFGALYAPKFPAIINGTKGGSEINSELTETTANLLNPVFYQNVKDHKESQFLNAISENSIQGWNTTIPFRMYHGTNDETIPYANSEAVFNSFKNVGTNLTLTPIPGATHSTAFEPMLFDFLPWFNSLR